MKHVQVKVYSKQIYPDHVEENEACYEGSFAVKGEHIFITYKEPEAGVRTVIKKESKAISIKRIGDIRGDLRFEVGTPCHTLYTMPYGSFEIEIKTHLCEVYLLEKGMQLNIEYTMFMGREKVSDHILMIKAN